eukprot:ANDGO_00037.mRNA.1 WD repeat-containing protein 5 homolog
MSVTARDSDLFSNSSPVPTLSARSATTLRSARTARSSSKGPQSMANANLNGAYIMSALRPIHFYRLQEVWEVHPGHALNLEEFVKVMQDCLGGSDFELKGAVLVNSLTGLFRQIDANGDETVEWSELMSYIVESGLLYRSSGFFEKLSLTITQDSGYVDRTKHPDRVSRMCFMPDLWKIALIDEAHGFKIYDSETGQFALHVSGLQFSPCALEYDEMHRCLFVSTGDGKIHIYDAVHWSLLDSTSLQTPQHVLLWSPQSQTLYSASMGGSLSGSQVLPVYAHGSRKCKFVQSGTYSFSVEDGHHDVVEDLIQIEYLDALVSASLDTTIRVWDTATRRVKRVLAGHRMGVRSIVFSGEQSLLFSAGYDREVHVWDAVLGALLFRLIGHSRPLVGLSISGCHLFSADVGGTFKVWDLRDLTQVTSFVDRTSQASQLDGFVTCTKTVADTTLQSLAERDRELNEKIARIHSFQDPDDVPNCSSEAGTAVQSGAPKLSQDFRIYSSSFSLSRFDCEVREIAASRSDTDVPVSFILYNDLNLMLLLIFGRHVALYDALTGQMALKTPDAMPADITAVAMGKGLRKFYLGDASGNVAEFNFSSLVKIRDLEMHEDEVTFVSCTAMDPAFFLSASWDRQVLFSEYDEEEGYQLKHKVSVRGGEEDATIVCGFVSDSLNMVAVGLSDGSIKIFDCFGGAPLGHLRCSGGAVVNNASEVCALCFLDPYPLFVAADASGRINFWATYPASNRNELLLSLEGAPSSEFSGGSLDLSDIPVSVTSLVFVKSERCLVVGDEEGRIKIIDLKTFLQDIPCVSRVDARYLRFSMSDVKGRVRTTSQHTSVFPDLRLRMTLDVIRVSQNIKLDQGSIFPIQSLTVLEKYNLILVLQRDVSVFGFEALSSSVTSLVNRGRLLERRNWDFYTPDDWRNRRREDIVEAREIQSRVLELTVDEIENGKPYGEAASDQFRLDFDKPQHWKPLLRDDKEESPLFKTFSDRQEEKQKEIELTEETADDNLLIMGAIVKGILPFDAISDPTKRLHALQYLKHESKNGSLGVPPTKS